MGVWDIIHKYGSVPVEGGSGGRGKLNLKVLFCKRCRVDVRESEWEDHFIRYHRGNSVAKKGPAPTKNTRMAQEKVARTNTPTNGRRVKTRHARVTRVAGPQPVEATTTGLSTGGTEVLPVKGGNPRLDTLFTRVSAVLIASERHMNETEVLARVSMTPMQWDTVKRMLRRTGRFIESGGEVWLE